MTQKQEQGSWEQLRPLIVEEWPLINTKNLNAVCEDEDGLIKLIADTAECTKVRARRDLAELRQISGSSGASTTSTSSRLEEQLTEKLSLLEERLQPFLEEGKNKANETLESIQSQGAAIVEQAEEQIDAVQKKVKEEIDKHLETTLPEAEKLITRNIWSSLAIVFGLGVILGLLGGSRGR